MPVWLEEYLWGSLVGLVPIPWFPWWFGYVAVDLAGPLWLRCWLVGLIFSLVGMHGVYPLDLCNVRYRGGGCYIF